MVIGVTGLYCAGKSTFMRHLEKQGYTCIFTDKLSHQALIDSTDIVVDIFGSGILSDNADNTSTNNAVTNTVIDKTNIDKEIIDTNKKVDKKVDKKVIDRKKLGSLVFSDKEKLKTLENILHPLVIAKTKAIISDTSELNTSVYAIESALLFDSGLDTLCDRIVVIDTNVFTRFFRALRRDRLGFLQTCKRFISQNKLYKQNLANIDNKRVYRVTKIEDMNRILTT